MRLSYRNLAPAVPRPSRKRGNAHLLRGGVVLHLEGRQLALGVRQLVRQLAGACGGHLRGPLRLAARTLVRLFQVPKLALRRL
eukprot:542192-Pyramimonas_sp.AAC.1